MEHKRITLFLVAGLVLGSLGTGMAYAAKNYEEFSIHTLVEKVKGEEKSTNVVALEGVTTTPDELMTQIDSKREDISNVQESGDERQQESIGEDRDGHHERDRRHDDDDDEEWEDDDEDDDRDDGRNGSVMTPAPAPTPTPVITPTPTPAPTPSSSPTTGATTGYTLAQVAAHGTTADCWSAVNGKVYNLTSFVDAHPGGTGPIASMCGKDGTSLFLSKHGLSKLSVVATK